MENQIIKSNPFSENKTKGKILQFPQTNINVNDNDNSEIVITVPKGYRAKVLIEKDQQNNLTTSSIEINTKIYNNVSSLNPNYDIIKVDKNNKGTQCIENTKNIENEIYEEGIFMKKSVMYDVLKEQLKFLLTAIIFIISSLVGITVFAIAGKYFIHPILYIVTLLMGIGWALTAIFSIKSNKRCI